jgi:hypothetical protein
MSTLFTPFRIGALELASRIVIAPMCQYSAVDGCMTDWHVIHLGHLALSGAALLTIEATAVLPEARITYADVGLWNDATEAAIARTLESIRRWSDMPIALQRACWPQGLDRIAMERWVAVCPRPSKRRADGRPVHDPIRGWPATASRSRPRRPQAGAGGLRCGGAARRAAQNRCRPDTLRARLSVARVPLAALQPARR